MRRLAFFAIAALLAGCHGSPAPPPDQTPQVVKQYAVNLGANYADVVGKLQVLDAAVQAFVAAPSAAGLQACQAAWMDAHHWYGECEYSRFYGGPIDQAQGAMNEWPIDETFIDYTPMTPDGGIINNPAMYPQITAEVLATADEMGGTENLSTGFHAIEFLLWGERASQAAGPGTRPYTDYVDGGTASNQDRRRTYLGVVTQMLLDAMRGLVAEWDLTNATSYGATLVGGDPQAGLTNVFRGLSQMAISELLYERMDDPLVTQNRKDEESCFSEDTLDDLIHNALGVEDAYLGRYATIAGDTMQGPSVSDLVAAKDASLDAQLRQTIASVRAAIDAIPPPFDHAVLAPAGSADHTAVVDAVNAFGPLQGQLDQAATALGIVNNL